MSKFIVSICALIVLAACSDSDRKSNGTTQKIDPNQSAINQIQSQQWCMYRPGLHLTEEIVRISFDQNYLYDSVKMRFSFDTLIKHDSGWVSYSFGNKKYEWQLVDKKDSSSYEYISSNTPYLSLIDTGNTIGSKKYLEMTSESYGLFSNGGKLSTVFGDCSEEISRAKAADKFDYAIFAFQQRNILRNKDGYIFWDLKFPTAKVKASEVYSQLWCQSDRYLSYMGGNKVNVIYFTDKGDIIHSQSRWNSDFDRREEVLPFKVETKYLSQKYALDESSGEMRILHIDNDKKEFNKYSFDVEFRTDGKKLVMITHDQMNDMYYRNGGDSKPMGLDRSSVYYSCSSLKTLDDYYWKQLEKIVNQNIQKILTKAPDYKVHNVLPYAN